MNNQIENENKDPLIGEVLTPNERQHLFANIATLTDFVKIFKLKNFNVRYGQDVNGRMAYQLVYAVENN